MGCSAHTAFWKLVEILLTLKASLPSSPPLSQTSNEQALCTPRSKKSNKANGF